MKTFKASVEFHSVERKWETKDLFTRKTAAPLPFWREKKKKNVFLIFWNGMEMILDSHSL